MARTASVCQRRLAGSVALGAFAAAAMLAAPSGAHAAPGCSSADSLSAGVQKKEAAFRCLLNRERAERALPALRWRVTLARGARRSSILMLRCRSFSHAPCGESPTRSVRTGGYRGLFAGENIAWGTGSYGTARSAFEGWMESPGHRRAMLNPVARAAGVAVKPRQRFQGYHGASLWTLSLGAG